MVVDVFKSDSVDPYETASLGLNCLLSHVCVNA